METKSVGIGLTFEDHLRLSLSVELDSDGGTPSHFLDLLARAIEEEIWNELGDISSFRELIELPKPRGLGTTVEAIKILLSPEIKHRHEDLSPEVKERMDFVRRRARELLVPDDTNGHGGDRKSEGYKNQGSGRTLVRGEGEDYINYRLKHDRPDLAEQVFASELSAHKAGQMAGFIKQRQKFVPGDVEQTVGALERHYDAEGYEKLQEAMIPKVIEEIVQVIKRKFDNKQIRQLIELLSA